MNKTLLTLVMAAGIVFTAFFAGRLRAADDKASFQVFEYATIHWAGKENTHFVRPNGQVEMLGPILAKARRPDRVDERAYLMNIAMNAAAREGFEFAGMTDNSIVMRRASPK